MSTNQLHYYAGDHTAKGFYPLYASNLQNLDHVIRLKGGPNHIKTNVLNKIADKWSREGFLLEFMHSSSDHEALDGLINPELKIGLYSGPSHTRGFGRWTMNCIDIDKLLKTEEQDKAAHYRSKIKEAWNYAHEAFQTGLEIHDDLEVIYISNMDFQRADQLTEDFIQHLKMKPVNSSPITKHRFFGASTPGGVLDYIPNLTENLTHRYFIKGRAGTGKSTFLKKVAAEAELKGYNVELYHCGFDPESIDMVIVREMGFCVFDSTDPHEYFPEKVGDSIVDLYSETVTAGTDEAHAEEIAELTTGYKSFMKKGIDYLKQAKYLNDELSSLYVTPPSFENELYDSVLQEISQYA
ncbi:hypothetical protein LF817_10135 [Halobacillus sp. A1]|uniref:hypothetical protein n=1 Tax=Halobacillus sp. A1 TaxID=2880262 RepID=UPI0020A64697|nr:hypothetical protein [Halobacillus sp. A1]MCP3031711.1 hypothetical protein [Halobacillus sp. A1]